jgi:tyrosinase
MLNPISSPGDPIFYLHHTYLDKVWWGWQALNLPIRLSEISGGNIQNPCIGFPEAPNGLNGTSPFTNVTIPGCDGNTTTVIPQSMDGDPGNVTTLGHVINMFGIIPNETIGDVMDIGNEFLCYEYI